MSTRSALLALCALLLTSPLRGETPTAGEVARQVYFVNHFEALKNVSFGNRKQPLVVVDRPAGARPRINTLIRRLNNDYTGGSVRARDLAIFRSGKLRGTGILVTVYRDPQRPMSFSIWLPALRKIRRHSEPEHDDTWGGSNFTFGDIYLRRPQDESHELLGKETFNECLHSLDLPASQRNRHTRDLPDASCAPRGRTVYKLKSTTRFSNWWYDYRIQWVDAESFADYRSIYYRNDKPIKILDKDWRGMGLEDPRAQYWLYWYAKTLGDGHEGMAFVPASAVKWNEDVDPGLWSERSLRRIKR